MGAVVLHSPFVFRSPVERRLTRVADQLRRERSELAVVDEQLTHLAGEADDARLRALVSETPLAGREAFSASRHAEARTVLGQIAHSRVHRLVTSTCSAVSGRRLKNAGLTRAS